MAQEAVGRPPEETLSLWKREQALLKARVVDQDTEAWQRDPAFAGLQRVGGVDVSFVKGDSVSACASLVVLSYPELEVLYEDSRLVHLTAPYLSGFLAFREVPFLVGAVQRLQEKEPSLMPQVLLVDGNGVLHPRARGSLRPLGRLRKGLVCPEAPAPLGIALPPARLRGGLPPGRPHGPALRRGGQEAAAGGRAGEGRPAQGPDPPPARRRGLLSSEGQLRGRPGQGRHPLPRLHSQDPWQPQAPRPRAGEEGSEAKGVAQGRPRRAPG
ncbi:endonuclease V isoform X5 [Myotis myotis]|uniref:endonuclease V isoform X5 n=1 Tax=Myotis myotis TaxID=51298 RepID=UPI00174AA8EF|nr:endonuclease V isoform X5 [Myotis myotis]